MLITLFSAALTIAGCIHSASTDSANANCNQDIEGETYSSFKDAVKRYGDDRWRVINKDMTARILAKGGKGGFEDARAIWFPYDSLRLFLCNIEKYSKEIGVGPDKLGVRIYYAVYNDSHGEYSNRHTVFMVPTFNSGENELKNLDFDPRLSAKEVAGRPDKTKIITLDAIAASGRTENLLLLGGAAPAANEPNGLIRNSGELCPPKCKPDYNSIFGAIDQ